MNVCAHVVELLRVVLRGLIEEGMMRGRQTLMTAAMRQREMVKLAQAHYRTCIRLGWLGLLPLILAR